MKFYSYSKSEFDVQVSEIAMFVANFIWPPCCWELRPLSNAIEFSVPKQYCRAKMILCQIKLAIQLKEGTWSVVAKHKYIWSKLISVSLGPSLLLSISQKFYHYVLYKLNNLTTNAFKTCSVSYCHFRTSDGFSNNIKPVEFPSKCLIFLKVW